MKHHLISVNWGALRGDAMKAKLASVETTLSQNTEDWLRLNAYTWIVYASQSVQDLYTMFLPHITQENRLLIIRVDDGEVYGWQAQWVWDWFTKHRKPARPTLLSTPPLTRDPRSGRPTS